MIQGEGRASLCTDLSPPGLKSRLQAWLHSSHGHSRQWLEHIFKQHVSCWGAGGCKITVMNVTLQLE